MSGMNVPGVTLADLVTNFRAYSNNPNATADDMVRHINAQQMRERIRVPITAGKGRWNFPRPFPEGILPVVSLQVETPDESGYLYDAKIIEGSTTNAKTDFVVNRFNASQTLGSTLTAIINTAIQFFAPITGVVTVTVNCEASAAAT